MSSNHTPDPALGDPAGMSGDLQDELLALLLREQGFSPGAAAAIRPRLPSPDAPLSAQQRRLWFLHQLDPANGSYVIPGAVRIRGLFDVERFRRVLDAVIDRHESLRTVFVESAGPARQVVRDRQPTWLVAEDIVAADPGERERLLIERARSAMALPFDLRTGPLLRTYVFRTAPDDSLILLAMHHIVSDGWSIGILIREIVELYAAGATGRDPVLPPLTLQYADFSVWQSEWRTGDVAAAQLAFWKRQLAGLPHLELPTDRPRPAVLTHSGATVRAALDAETTGAIRRLAQDSGATLFMLLVSAFAALLHRYTGQEDLAIGTPSANRNRTELEPLVGLFINALVLRADLTGDPTFRQLVDRVKRTALAAWAHEDLPFEEVVEVLQPDRTPSRNPLFQVMFVLQNAPEGRLDLPGLSFSPVDLPTTTSKFDISLYVVENGSGLSVLLEYNRDLFDEATAARMLDHYVRLAGGGAANPDVPVSALPMLTNEEERQVVFDWNATDSSYPTDASIHQLFARQAAETPDAIALRFGQVTMTYGELERRSNQLARRLEALGAGRGAVIGLLVERSFEMVVGLLGILKAGSAYLPLDSGHPPDRHVRLLAEVGVRLVVTQSSAPVPLPARSVAAVALDSSWHTIGTESDAPIDSDTGPLELAYVMFTSGSTGRPKGVAVPHRAVVRLVRGTEYVRFSGETFLQFAPVAFDASTFEIWGPLLNGGSLAIAPPGVLSLAELGRSLAEARVTTAWFTSGLFQRLVDHEIDALRGLRQLVAGGDVLSVAHVGAVRGAMPELRLVNGFGPTETTTFACCHPVAEITPAVARVPIGAPIANTRAYVLDARLGPVPIGVAGELYIGGDGVAQGYFGRPELTAERFVPDPFASEPGRRMYRTGDMVRWLPEGTIDFLGRRDRQVKIRGFRIEAGEIEAELTAHPAVRGAAVVVHRTDAGERELVAYIAADDVPDVQPQALRAFLAARLPDYMLPSVLVRLDLLPLTVNGKVDRAALPSPGERATAAEYCAPRTPDEQLIARIWSDVLRVDRVGARDDFFELGGHSLLATQVIARLRDEAAVDISLRALFLEPTVEALAREVARVRAAGDPAVTAIESIPRSGARRRAGRGSPTP